MEDVKQILVVSMIKNSWRNWYELESICRSVA
jgi:hypothetical protein